MRCACIEDAGKIPIMALTCLCESMNGSDHAYVFCNSSTFNFTGEESGRCHLQTVDEVLFSLLGPRRSPFFFPVTFTYILIFITGVLGNLLTCTVITKDRKMRTPSNLYLFSLAISDLLVLLFGMPLEIYELWQNYPFPFGESICCFKIFLFEMVCFASVLNVTVLSVERYIAVIHPLKTRYAITNKHAQRVIASVWAVSLLCAIPNTSLHGLQYQYLPERVLESATCNLLKPKWIYNLVIQVTTVLFYFVPMMMISVLYLMIGLTLGRGQKQRKDKLGTHSNGSWKINLDSKRKRQVIKMHFVVVLVFAICWAPFHIDRLLWSFITSWTDHMYNIFEYVHIISGVLFYLSSAVNPIIYNLLSSRFRERFQVLVCSRLPTGSSRNDSTPFYVIPKDPPLMSKSRSAGDPFPFVIIISGWGQGNEGKQNTLCDLI